MKFSYLLSGIFLCSLTQTILSEEFNDFKDDTANKFRELRNKLDSENFDVENSEESNPIDERSDENDAYRKRDKRAANVAAIQVDPNFQLTRTGFLHEIKDAFLGRKINYDNINHVLDDNVRAAVVRQLKLKKTNPDDPDSVLKETGKVVLSMNNVDTPDDDYDVIIPTDVKPVDKTRTLRVREIRRKSLSSLANATVDFTDITGTTQFSTKGQPRDMKAFTFDNPTLVSFHYYRNIYEI